MKLTITTGSEGDFFNRGKEVARRLVQGELLEPEGIISFEEPEDLIELITAGLLDLFRAVKEMPGSIAEVARRLHRDRSAVKRDVDLLAEAGLIRVDDRPLHGHGRMKFLTASADNIELIIQVR